MAGMSPRLVLLVVALAGFCLDQRLYRGCGGGSLNGSALSSLSSEMHAVSSAGHNLHGLSLVVAVGFQAGTFRATGGCVQARQRQQVWVLQLAQYWVLQWEPWLALERLELIVDVLSCLPRSEFSGAQWL